MNQIGTSDKEKLNEYKKIHHLLNEKHYKTIRFQVKTYILNREITVINLSFWQNFTGHLLKEEKCNLRDSMT